MLGRDFEHELRDLWTEQHATHGMQNYDARREAKAVLDEKLLTWAQSIDRTHRPTSIIEAVAVAYAHVILHCQRVGSSPAWETFCQPPEATVNYVGSKGWRVCWESGPRDWAVADSLGEGGVVPYRFCSSAKFWTEPYYGFDLIWYAA